MSHLTIAQFEAITRRVLDRDGLDGYLPTAIYPARRVVRALEDASESGGIEDVALRWAQQHAERGEEFLVAFKVDATHSRILRQTPTGLRKRSFRHLTPP